MRSCILIPTMKLVLLMIIYHFTTMISMKIAIWEVIASETMDLIVHLTLVVEIIANLHMMIVTIEQGLHVSKEMITEKETIVMVGIVMILILTEGRAITEDEIIMRESMTEEA